MDPATSFREAAVNAAHASEKKVYDFSSRFRRPVDAERWVEKQEQNAGKRVGEELKAARQAMIWEGEESSRRASDSDQAGRTRAHSQAVESAARYSVCARRIDAILSGTSTPKVDEQATPAEVAKKDKAENERWRKASKEAFPRKAKPKKTTSAYDPVASKAERRKRVKDGKCEKCGKDRGNSPYVGRCVSCVVEDRELKRRLRKGKAWKDTKIGRPPVARKTS